MPGLMSSRYRMVKVHHRLGVHHIGAAVVLVSGIRHSGPYAAYHHIRRFRIAVFVDGVLCVPSQSCGEGLRDADRCRAFAPAHRSHRLLRTSSPDRGRDTAGCRKPCGSLCRWSCPDVPVFIVEAGHEDDGQTNRLQHVRHIAFLVRFRLKGNPAVILGGGLGLPDQTFDVAIFLIMRRWVLTSSTVTIIRYHCLGLQFPGSPVRSLPSARQHAARPAGH